MLVLGNIQAAQLDDSPVSKALCTSQEAISRCQYLTLLDSYTTAAVWIICNGFVKIKIET